MRLGFDLDGTILDCAPRQIGVMQGMLEKHGLPFASNEFWQAKRAGSSNRHYLKERYALPDADLDAFDAEWLDKIESTAWLARDRLLPGAEDVLRSLNETGHVFMLLTARQSPEGVHETLKRLRLTDLFATVEIVAPAKAAREKATALVTHKIEAYFGDTESDAEAAISAHVPFYAVTTGMRSEAFFRKRQITRTFPALTAAIDRALEES